MGMRKTRTRGGAEKQGSVPGTTLSVLEEETTLLPESEGTNGSVHSSCTM